MSHPLPAQGLLQVGRKTVRAALGILEVEGLLRTTNGSRRVIVMKRIPKPSAPS